MKKKLFNDKLHFTIILNTENLSLFLEDIHEELPNTSKGSMSNSLDHGIPGVCATSSWFG